MRATFLKMPSTEEEWRVVARNFREKWNYPHCIGAIDGKHCVIKAPINSGSLYFNYKSSFSVVLMALVDANNQFLCVDIGAYGRQSDAGVFGNSALGQALEAPNNLNIPPSEVIQGAEHLGPLPYVVVGDAAFPLQQHIMRPYPGRECTLAEAAYNYRHSRARRIVECAFGILATRWRVYYTRMAIFPVNVTKVIQATIILHNMLQVDTTPGVNVDDVDEGERPEVEGLADLPRRGGRVAADIAEIRNRFRTYFLENPLAWQDAHIRRGLD